MSSPPGWSVANERIPVQKDWLQPVLTDTCHIIDKWQLTAGGHREASRHAVTG